MVLSSRKWRLRHIVLWIVLTGLVFWWRGPAYRRAFVPEFYPPGAVLFQPDFFQEWASARNRFNDLPIYAPHEITLERYLGLRPNTASPYYIAVNAHPPTAVLLVLPFAGLEFADAFPLWNVLSLLALAVSAWLIVYHLGLHFSCWDLLPSVTLLLLCHPFWHQMIQGQLNLILLLLVTGAWASDRTEHPILAGTLLAAAAALKLYPAFLFLYFVLRARWHAVVAGIATFILLTILSTLVLGPQAYHDYFLRVLPQTSMWRSDWHNFSLSGMWFKLFDPRRQFPPVEIRPILWSPLLAWAGALCSAIALLAVLYRVVTQLRSIEGADLGFALCILAMFLVSPITWGHYLLLLALPIAVLWQRCPPSGIGREVVMACLFVLWWDPFMVVEHGLILLDVEKSRSSGEWITGPLETLTALSVPCYTLIALFVLSLRTACRNQAMTSADSARKAAAT